MTYALKPDSRYGQEITPPREDAPKVHRLADLLANPALLRPPRAIIPRMAFQARITLFAAPRKAGKSTIAGAAVSAATNGRAILGESVKGISVLWCGLDEPLDDAARRFRDEDANPSLVWVLEPPATVSQVVAVAIQLAVDLVVIDAIGDLAVREVDNENDSMAVKRLLVPLRDLARTHHIAVLLLHHTNRQSGRSRGSGVFEDIADLILTVAIDDRDPTVRRITAEGRLGVEDFRLRWTPDGLELADAEATPHQRLLAIIGAKPGASTREIRKSAGMSPSDVQAALASLRGQGTIENRGSRSQNEWHVVATGNRPETAP